MALLCRLEEAGRSAARLARLLREQEVPGSNPGAPMVKQKGPATSAGPFHSPAPPPYGAEGCGSAGAAGGGSNRYSGRHAPSSR